jgi:sterol desaturase/sphingolipid hydroxylase (fatty acid hydroxylase superfamily)
VNKILENIYEVLLYIFNYPYLQALVIPIIIVMLIWILERIFLKRRISENFKSDKKTFFNELLLWVIHYTPFANIFAAISCFGLFNFLKIFLRSIPFDFILNIDKTYLVIILIIMVDLSGYVCHILLHKFKLLWNFHQFHHSAKKFNVLTVHRVHFFEISFIKLSQTGTLIVLGGNLEVFWSWYIISSISGCIKHSNFRFNYPGILKYIFQSPAHHWVHHSDNINHYNTNYGEVFQIWDTIFRTGYNPNNEEMKNLSIGTDETKSNAGNFIELFIFPYKKLIGKGKCYSPNTSIDKR